MKRHSLKIWPEQYEAVRSGAKKHETRVNDRGFAVGDVLELNEWDPATRESTGRTLFRRVTWVSTGFGIPDGIVVMSVEPLPGQPAELHHV